MNRKIKTPLHLLVLLTMLVLGIASCSTDIRRSTDAVGEGSERQRVLLDPGWMFHPGHISPTDQVITAGYDDATWQRIDLPHDYALDGTYVQSDDIAQRSHGYLPVDVAWYRKHAFISEKDRGKILELDFDGVFRDSQVWINGQFLGRHPSGYTPFSYDITKFAKFGSDNVIVVCVDPREFEGHWYEGAGIYRHVYLTAMPRLHLAKWGTYVISTVPGGEHGADAQADLTIQTTLENDATATMDCQVVSEIIGPDGKSLPKIESTHSVPAHGRQAATQRTVIERPRLWSLTSPWLYELRSVIQQNGKTVDAMTTTFGIRTITFDADTGFFLNGRHVEIQGCANHQDMPAVGIAVPDSLQPWRVQKLKDMGCNGWRTAHNPPNEAVLDACDRIGMLVMDENRHLGDAYGSHSPPGTRAGDLSDLATMIQRDRHHPSVIMWSLCNEEGLRGKPEGMRLFAAMKDVVHRYDATRPITSAINGSWIAKGITDEDLLGVNYHDREYDDFRRGNPRLAMFGSETTNQKTTRGEYAETPGTGMCSSYNLSERGWLAVADRPFIAGAYVWTGFDYRGEPNPYGWPHISNNTGLMDVCGFSKDKYYYFESCWSSKPMVHLLPDSWNWPDKKGQNIRVLAFSNAERVELFLNGKSLGAQDMVHDAHVEWQVPYEPGALSARAYSGGKLVATDNVETAGPPDRIQLSVSRTQLRANQQDTVIVAACLVDKKGRVVPDMDRRLTFQLTGGGRILGVGNGNPADHDPDRANQRRTFHGRCIAIIQAGVEPTVIKVAATSPQIAADHLQFVVR